MTNADIAINWTRDAINMTVAGGRIAFPMYPDSSKHERKYIAKGIQALPEVAHCEINRKYVIVTLQGEAV